MACLLWLVLAPPTARASSLEQIRACMAANLPEASSQQTLCHRQIHGQSSRDTEATVFWQRTAEGASQLRVEVDAPPDDRGTAYLVLERGDELDTWVFLPEIGRVRRTPPPQWVLDLWHRATGALRRSESALISAGEFAGRPVWVVEVTAPATEERYRRLVYRVDQSSCLPLEADVFGGGDRIERIVRVDPASIRRIEDRWTPGYVVAERVGRETWDLLRVASLQLDPDLPARWFTPGDLERRRSRKAAAEKCDWTDIGAVATPPAEKESAAKNGTETFPVCFTLDADDVRYFQRRYRKARAAETRSSEELLEQTRSIVARAKGSPKTPEFVLEAISTLEDLVHLAEDREYAARPALRNDVLAGLAYFADPDDLVRDDVPGLGLLDDAIVIQLIAKDFRHELRGYRNIQAGPRQPPPQAQLRSQPGAPGEDHARASNRSCSRRGVRALPACRA
jgi:uncharacterized membrane protein YkvA (DUF1232 family)